MNRNFAFTLSEILITLGIIGVVSAITLPILNNKINDMQYDRARSKALSTIGDACRLLAVQGDIGSAIDAEDFVKNYLSKQLKIVKYCNSNHLSDCGLPANFKMLGTNQTINMPTTFAELGLPSHNVSSQYYKIRKNTNFNFGFLIANGYSVNLFYNPNCTVNTGNSNSKGPDYVCMNAIYDMNGKRNPNQVGKDIGFVTVLYPNETSKAVAPKPYTERFSKYNWTEGNALCKGLNGNYTLPTIEELLSMAINGKLLNADGTGWTWSSSEYGTKFAFGISFGPGGVGYDYKSYKGQIFCVDRK